MSTTGPIVRIFISSPGDVRVEREKARRVIEGLQRHIPRATLVPVLWEDLALPATASFQATIDVLLHQQPIDVAVFILWSRLGSPLGPEIRRANGTSYRGGTEREFDLMLTAFEQSGQRRPVVLAYARNDEAAFRQSLADCPGARLEELVSQRKLAESFIREQFYDKEGHNVRALHNYREPVSFAQQLHTHLRQVLEDLLGIDAAPRWLAAPYRGLEFFDSEHAAIFHGRDEEVCDLLQRLRDQKRAGCAFAVIVGASGSGKSSLARAGVAAALAHHSYDENVREWRATTFVPGLAEGDFCRALTLALARQLPELCTSASAVDDIASGLAKDAELTIRLGILPAFARAAEKAGGATQLLLVLDQMEELWTDNRVAANSREQFLGIVEALARSGPITILATLRSDFYSHAQDSRTFLRLKGERGHFDLLPPSSTALQRIIAEPARLAGLRFERDERTGRMLEEVVLRDASRDPAALPLLQYALHELYCRRDERSRLLTFDAYERLGGIEGCLGHRAAEVCGALSAEAREALPELLSFLVTVDIEGEQTAVRRRAPLSDLTATPARRNLAESLIAARFLTTDRQDGRAFASLAHEALIGRWEQVVEWVADNREQLRLRARVEQSQQRWEQHEREVSLLLAAGLPLEEGRQLLMTAGHLLNPGTAGYITASLDHHQALAVRALRRRRAAMAGLSALTVLALLASALAWIKQREANEQTVVAKAAQQKALDLLRATRIQLATTFLQHGLGEESAGRLATMRRDFVQAWVISPEDDPLRAACERILVDRLGGKGRAIGLVLRHAQAVQAVAFSPDDTRVATASADGTVRLSDARTGAPLGEVMRHDDAVNAVAFSPDGARLLTGSKDKTARLWNAQTGAALGQPMLHEGEVNAVMFGPDGTRLITGSNDKAARLWDGNSGKLIGKPLQHEGAVTAVAFSSDGGRALTGSNDQTARLWDAATGAALGEPLRHANSVSAIAFNTLGTRIVTASSDKTARLWDAHTTEAIGMPLQHDDFVNSVAFSPDGTRVVTGSWKAARIWDVEHCTPVGLPLPHEGWVDVVAYHRDGRQLLTSCGDGTARLWDAHTGAPLGAPLRHDEAVTSAAFNADGRSLVTGSLDGTARLWSSAGTGPVVATLRHEQPVTSLAFSRDGMLVITGSQDNTARVWSAADGAPWKDPLRHDGAVVSVAFSPDGARAVTASWDETARVWDVGRGVPAGEKLQHEGWVVAAAFSPDGRRIITGSKDKTARLWNAETGASVGKPLAHDDEVNAVAFSPDGTRIVTAAGNVARLWNAATGEPVGEPMSHTGPVVVVAYSPDNARVVTGSWDNTARLWDTHHGLPVGEAMQHDGFVVAVAFSLDGARVVTGSWDKSGRLWDGRSGASLGEPMRHESTVHAVALSPEGTRVITGSSDNAVRMWDAHTGAPLHEPLAHNDWVGAVAFSPDGRRVASASNDHTSRIWDARPRPVPGDLRTWIEFQSGNSADEAEHFRDLSFEELQRRLEILQNDQDYMARLRRELPR